MPFCSVFLEHFFLPRLRRVRYRSCSPSSACKRKSRCEMRRLQRRISGLQCLGGWAVLPLSFLCFAASTRCFCCSCLLNFFKIPNLPALLSSPPQITQLSRLRSPHAPLHYRISPLFPCLLQTGQFFGTLHFSVAVDTAARRGRITTCCKRWAPTCELFNTATALTIFTLLK